MEATLTRQLTNEQLGEILIAAVGAEACEEAYGTCDPAFVGIAAIAYGDINPDGELN